MNAISPLRDRTEDFAMASAADRRIALWMTQEEADAALMLLLEAPPTKQISGEVMERLLCRVADVQREFSREAPAPAGVRRAARRRAVRRVRPRKRPAA